MVFKIKTPFVRWKEKMQKEMQWHQKFAWLPVQIPQKEQDGLSYWIWLSKYYTRRPCKYLDWENHCTRDFKRDSRILLLPPEYALDDFELLTREENEEETPKSNRWNISRTKKI